MGFERWVDYALDVPMYFVKHGDDYVDASGQSFRDLMAGKLPAMPGARATISDWANHISTIFPEVRLKRYLEMRGADSGSLPNLLALPAFWVGILYDDASLDAAWDLVKHWTAEQRQKLRDDVPTQGLAAKIGGRTVFEIATESLSLARAGLERRKRRDVGGEDETHYLEVLDDRLARGTTPAQELLDKFHGPWGGSVDPIYAEEAY
jgi:glutamate--cysteine ligase